MNHSNCPTVSYFKRYMRVTEWFDLNHFNAVSTLTNDAGMLINDDQVIAANIPPVRPRVPRSACSNELYDLMERCWEEVPVERPTFPKIKERLKKVIGDVGDNIVDLLFRRMEQYAMDLELKVAEKTQQFMDEKTRSEQLLSQLLPK